MCSSLGWMRRFICLIDPFYRRATSSALMCDLDASSLEGLLVHRRNASKFCQLQAAQWFGSRVVPNCGLLTTRVGGSRLQSPLVTPRRHLPPFQLTSGGCQTPINRARVDSASADRRRSHCRPLQSNSRRCRNAGRDHQSSPIGRNVRRQGCACDGHGPSPAN
jgi:hypothetical protein